ncbi:MAG TPA: alpha/beta hydrolase [Micromonosporaceae bacterium]|nr:alpha/beta hydrolase [Micromonosporaceae bacterium]
MHTDLVARDGVKLRVLRTDLHPDQPTVLFVNAVGMVSELATGLAGGFSQAGFNFVTWDLRGSPGPSLGRRDCTLASHAQDAVQILDELGVGAVHVLGWCTGASAALFLAERLGDRMRALVAVDGAYLFDGVPGAPLGNAMYAMCKDIVADAGTAARYHELTRPRGNEATVLGLEHAPDLVDHMTLPYRQGLDELVRYAFAIWSACDYEPVAALHRVDRPMLLTARQDDRMVSYRNSVRAAGHVAGAQVRIADSGGHYGLFTDTTAVPEIAAFLRAQQ